MSLLLKGRDWPLNVVATPRGPESLLHCGPFDVKAKTTEQTALACQKGEGRGGGWGCGGAPNTPTSPTADRGSVSSPWPRTKRVRRRGAATEAPVVPSRSLTDPSTQPGTFLFPPPPPPLMRDETPRSLHKVHGSCLDFRPWMFDLALFVCCRQTRGTAASSRVGTRTHTQKTQDS